MKLTLHDQDDACVIEISGRMDSEAAELRDTVRRKVDEGSRSVVLELGAVRMTNSIGLGMLVEAYKAARAGGANFALANVQPQVRTVLTYTKLDTILQICDSLEDAVAAVSK